MKQTMDIEVNPQSMSSALLPLATMKSVNRLQPLFNVDEKQSTADLNSGGF